MAILDQINYRITGDPTRPKMVFLHGLMGFLNNWGRITREMSQQYCCLVYDQRGHGKSFKPEAGYQPEDYAQDLYEIIEALGWEKIILVGHSMGGRNALCFAEKYPERLEKLVIVDISPDLKADSAIYFEKMLNFVPTPFADLEQAKSFFEHDFAKNFPSKEDILVLSRFLFANLESTPQGKVDWRFSKTAIIESAKLGRSGILWDWFTSLKIPCLYIRGARSKDLPLETYEKVLEVNPRIQGVEISDAGHWVHSEQPEFFLKELKNFVGYNNN